MTSANSPISSAETSIDAFKELMAQVPTSVAVVSVSAKSGLKACTVSSFISVDITNPTILFVLKNNSTTLEAIKAELNFSVNLLTSRQEDLSRFYATVNKPINSDNFENWKFSENAVPLLKNCKSWLVCKLHSLTELSSATVVIAKVASFELVKEELPLLYYSRNYPKISAT